MKLARLAALALAIALIVVSSRALGAPRVTIVVRNVSDSAVEAFETQLRAELLTMGFEVLTLPEPPSSVTPESLEAIAEKTQAIAAIIIEQPEGSITGRLWITERVTGKTLIRTVRPEKMSPDAPTIFALRAVELLRASLLELQESHPPRGTVPVPEQVQKLVTPAPKVTPPRPAPQPRPASASTRSAEPRPGAPGRPMWAVSAGLRLLTGPGGMPWGLGPTLALSWYPRPQWAIQVVGAGPFNGRVEDGGAAATTNQAMFGARVRFGVLRGSVVPYVAAGAGMHLLAARGVHAPPSRSRSDSAWTPYVSGALGVSFRSNPNFAFFAEAEASVTAARQRIALGDKVTASAGRPLVAATLGAEVSW